MNIRTVGHTLATGGVFTMREVTEAAKNDKALALRLGATRISDQLLKKVNDPIKDQFAATAVTVVRGGVLALNTARAIETFKSPTSTTIDKIMDGLHVAFDVVGLAGGIAALANPEYASLGQRLLGFSYAFDAVSHAYRGFNHAGNRVKLWTTELHEAKEAEKRRQQQDRQGKCPEAPNPPQQKPPQNPEVEVTIKGQSEAVSKILRGQKQISFGGGKAMLTSTAR